MNHHQNLISYDPQLSWY